MLTKSSRRQNQSSCFSLVLKTNWSQHFLLFPTGLLRQCNNLISFTRRSGVIWCFGHDTTTVMTRYASCFGRTCAIAPPRRCSWPWRALTEDPLSQRRRHCLSDAHVALLPLWFCSTLVLFHFSALHSMTSGAASLAASVVELYTHLKTGLKWNSWWGFVPSNESFSPQSFHSKSILIKDVPWIHDSSQAILSLLHHCLVFLL